MVIKQILDRRSVREYQSKDVSKEDINEIIKAGQFAPSAMGNHAVEFIVVTESETKQKLHQIVGQDFIKNAPVLIIPTTDSNKTNCPIRDLSVATENMFLQATELGLGTVWKNVGKELEDQVKKLLGVPDSSRIINIIPVGYPKTKPNPHTDQDFDFEKIHDESW